jgi:hypothetical protein
MAGGAPRRFIGAGGAPGWGGRELITDINGFNTIEGVKARFEGDYWGRVMWEGCKSSGASEARGSSAG